jgi:YHS domain-containing protein
MVFHRGELAVQHKAGVEAEAAILAGMISPQIPRKALALVEGQQMAIAGSVDVTGAVWASLLTGATGFIQLETESTLRLNGNANISSTVDGATYYFASEANKAKFDADSATYMPQYGGFCAVAVSEGKTFPVDPETYKVTDGKLYLFYNGELGNTKPQWEEDEAIRKAKADEHWAKGDLVPG